MRSEHASGAPHPQPLSPFRGEGSQVGCCFDSGFVRVCQCASPVQLGVRVGSPPRQTGLSDWLPSP